MGPLLGYVKFSICLCWFVSIRLSTVRAECQVAEDCKRMSKKELDPKVNPYPDRADWKELEWREETKEGDQVVDLVFVVDGSSSVSDTDFKLLMKWIASLSSAFDVSKGSFQIGMVQYSHWYRARNAERQKDMKTEIALGSCSELSCFKSKLSAVRRMGHTTYTGYAINKTVNEDFKSSKHFKESVKILVLITDSASQDRVLESANYARQQNISLFAVGVGDDADIYTLREIATGDPYDSLRIYMVPNFAELGSIDSSLLSEIRSNYMEYVCPPLPLPIHGKLNCNKLNNLRSKCTLQCDYGGYEEKHDNFCLVVDQKVSWWKGPADCRVVCKQKQFDLLVILDSSSSVTCKGFILAKKFLIALLDGMHIGMEDIMVASIRYNSDVVVEFEYKDHKTKQSLVEAIRIMSYCGRGTRTGNALKAAVDKQFSTTSGRRPGIPHITLLITDGPAQDDEIVEEYSAKLRQTSKVFAIGVDKASLADLETISPSPIFPGSSRIYGGYEDLLNATLVRNLLQSFCDAANAVTRTYCFRSELRANASCSSERNNSVPVGTTCDLLCPGGYFAPLKSKALCSYDGNWSFEKWNCERKDCEKPKDNEGVVAICLSGYKIDSVCTFKCKPGYEIVPTKDQGHCEKTDKNTTISCMRTCKGRENEDPIWDMEPVTCRKTDTCMPSSCVNGKCKKQRNGYFCECEPGYEGEICHVNIDDCKENCNNGTCIDKTNGYECRCKRGYDGKDCSMTVNACENDPCINGKCVEQEITYDCDTAGNCSKKDIGYKCLCQSGWQGINCSKDIDECLSSPCGRGNKCFNTFGSYSCGFEPRNDHCRPGICENGGKCTSSYQSYTCQCTPGYSGKNCTIDVNECADEPCQNGSCEDGVNKYTCTCDVGYTGMRCETDINECYPNPCKNGVCRQYKIGSYRCTCDPGFTGRDCRMAIDECESAPCQNNATCENMKADFKCICTSGFEGRICDQDINECQVEENKCGQHGICRNTVGSFYCECLHGYEGNYCEDDIDECSTIPPLCGDHGTCANLLGDFNCTCSSEYYGRKCDKKICSFPKLLSRVGRMNCSGAGLPGTKCSLSCPRGMRLKRKSRRVNAISQTEIACKEGGVWSQTDVLRDFTWECENITCRHVDEVMITPHLKDKAQHINCTNGNNVGSICTLTCQRYFSPEGNAVRQCSADGSWSGPRWKCVERSCSSQRPVLINGKYECSDGERQGSFCMANCNPGFIQDERNIGRISCNEIDGKLEWIKLHRGDKICRPSECESSVNLMTLDVIGSDLSFRRLPYKEENKKKGKQEQACNGKAILAVNVTKGKDVAIQLWYGKTIEGYHAVFSSNESTNGLTAWLHPHEYLLSGVGQSVSSSGFRGNMNGKADSMYLPPSSVVTVTLSYNKWKWQSKGREWENRVKTPITNERQDWYTVHFGMNRVPNLDEFYDVYKNGTGLCKVCFIES